MTITQHILILITAVSIAVFIVRPLINRYITSLYDRPVRTIPPKMLKFLSKEEKITIERDIKLNKLLKHTKKHTIFSILKKVGQILLIPITLYKYF